MSETTRAPPGMLPAHLTHRGLDLHRALVRTELGPMRPVHQPA